MATYPLLVSILQIPGRLDAVIVQEQAVLLPDPPHVFYRYLHQQLVYIILDKPSHIEHAAVLWMLLDNLYGHFGKAFRWTNPDRNRDTGMLPHARFDGVGAFS